MFINNNVTPQYIVAKDFCECLTWYKYLAEASLIFFKLSQQSDSRKFNTGIIFYDNKTPHFKGIIPLMRLRV